MQKVSCVYVVFACEGSVCLGIKTGGKFLTRCFLLISQCVFLSFLYAAAVSDKVRLLQSNMRPYAGARGASVDLYIQ